MRNLTLKEFMLLAIALLAIIGLYIGNAVGLISFNELLNRIVGGEPDKSCNLDSDCAMKRTDCSVCFYYSKGDAVNKNWEPYCPLKEWGRLCPQALPRWASHYAICESNKCKIVTNKDFQIIIDENEQKIIEDITATLGIEIKSLKEYFPGLPCDGNICMMYSTMTSSPP